MTRGSNPLLGSKTITIMEVEDFSTKNKSTRYSIMEKTVIRAAKHFSAREWQESIEGKSKSEIEEIVFKKIESYLWDSITNNYFPEIKITPSKLLTIIEDSEMELNQKITNVFGISCWNNLTDHTKYKIFSFFETVNHPPIDLTPISREELIKKSQELIKESDDLLDRLNRLL